MRTPQALSIALLSILFAMGSTCTTVTSPAPGSVFHEPQTVPITAEADGAVRVEFWDGNALVYVDTTAPYVFDWEITAADNGVHEWRTRAYGTDGSVFESPAVSVTVEMPGTGSFEPGLVGFVPAVGEARDAVADASTGLVYVASDFGLSVVDVSDPTAPLAIGAANPPFYGERLAVAGSLAVVTGNGESARIVDLTDPGAPATIATVAGIMRGVAMSGRYAYLLEEVRGVPRHLDLVVVDLAVASAPSVIGRTTLPALLSSSGSTQMDVVGSRLYVGTAAGLQIVDVNQPAAPRILGSVATPNKPRAVAVANGYAFVADWTSLVVADVRNPASPSLVGSLPIAATAVAAEGNRVYVLGGASFHVVDASNPAAPRLIGSGASHEAESVSVAGGLAFLASPALYPVLDAGGLFVVNVASAVPRDLANTGAGDSTWAVAADGPRAIAVRSELEVLDVSDPRMPETLGTLPGNLLGAALQGQFGYTLEIVSGSPARVDFLVVDLATPAAPRVAGRLPLGGLPTSSTTRIQAQGSLVYVAATDAGLQIVDVSRPSAPRLRASVDTPARPRGVAVANGHAWIADESSLVAVDVRNPDRPLVVGTSSVPALDVAAQGNQLYVLGGGYFTILGVSNPGSPSILKVIPKPTSVALDVVGNMVSLVTWTANITGTRSAIELVDVSDPSRPAIVDEIPLPGLVRTVTAADGFAYAADDAAVIDVVQP